MVKLQYPPKDNYFLQGQKQYPQKHNDILKDKQTKYLPKDIENKAVSTKG